MSIQFRFSKGIFAATLSLLLPAPAASLAADAKEAKPANSGEGRYTKQELEVQATQTNLTKPDAPPPPKKETRSDADGRRSSARRRRRRSRRSSTRRSARCAA